MKNYFYLLNKTKYELFEPPTDTDYDIIEKFKKLYFDNNEELFIDELIFCRLDNLCIVILFILDTLEDFLAKKIFDIIHNVYSEKNAYELINEVSLKKCSSENNGKAKKKLKKGKKKKSGCFGVDGKEEKEDDININIRSSISANINTCINTKINTCINSNVNTGTNTNINPSVNINKPNNTNINNNSNSLSSYHISLEIKEETNNLKNNLISNNQSSNDNTEIKAINSNSTANTTPNSGDSNRKMSWRKSKNNIH
jgi:hypothetical protein